MESSNTLEAPHPKRKREPSMLSGQLGEFFCVDVDGNALFIHPRLDGESPVVFLESLRLASWLPGADPLLQRLSMLLRNTLELDLFCSLFGEFSVETSPLEAIQKAMHRLEYEPIDRNAYRYLTSC